MAQREETYDERVARVGGFPAPYVPTDEEPVRPYAQAQAEFDAAHEAGEDEGLTAVDTEDTQAALTPVETESAPPVEPTEPPSS